MQSLTLPKNSKNATKQRAKESIKFVLRITPEQSEIIEFLAKLSGNTVQEYIYDNIKSVLSSGILDQIEDDKEREKARKDWDETLTTFSMDRMVSLRCELEGQSPQLDAIAKAAKAWGSKNPSEFLSSAFLSVALGHLDQLNIFDTSGMKKTLEA